MTITALPTFPQRSDSSTFSTRREPFIEALGTFRTELDSTASAANSNETSTATSATNASQSAVEASTSASSAVPNSTLAVASKDAAVASSSAALASANAAKTSEVSAKDSSVIATTAASDALFAANATANVVAQKSTIRPSTRPSLSLDFAGSKVLDPRITFTRNSISSYIDYDGLLKYAPAGKPCFAYDPITGEALGLQIFESRTNVLTYTEDFNNAAWAATGGTVTPSTIAAPDGTITADSFIENSGSNDPRFPVAVTLSAAQTYTLSIYAKLVPGSAQRFLMLVFNTGFSANCGCNFDLVTGSVGTSVNATGTAQPIANGWYRFSITTGLTATGGGSSFRVRLSNVNTSFNITSPVAYTGDGVSGIYIWGAQLEAGSFATPYIPASLTHTGRASTGTFIGSNGLIQSAASGVARYNYNPLNLTLAPKLLLEEQRPNLLTYSDQFDNAAWIKALGSPTVSANVETAPDGTLTADKLVEDTLNGQKILRQNVSLLANTVYTISIFAKAKERTKFELSHANQANWSASGTATVDLSAGTISSSIAGSTVSITPVGNGWYRCAVTLSFGGVNAVGGINIGLNNGTTSSYTGDGTSGIYIWGAQLEAGAYPTSYIPTTTAQVTRSADTSTSSATTRAADQVSITGTNFSSWYNQCEGSVFVDFKCTSPGATFPIIYMLSDGTGANCIQNTYGSSQNKFVITAMNVSSANIVVTASTGSEANCAGSYIANYAAAAFNSSFIGSDSSVVLPTVNKLTIGSRQDTAGSFINGYIKKLSYYPKRLSLTELVALTS